MAEIAAFDPSGKETGAQMFLNAAEFTQVQMKLETKSPYPPLGYNI